MSVSVLEMEAARRDPCVFADVLIGKPLWRHQQEVARSRARYRVICAGRQVGKSLLLAVLALHKAFSEPNVSVLMISGGEDAAKRLLAEAAGMAMASPLLAGAVIDESKSVLTLSTGSTIRAVPASERQVRGWSVDLLIIDEAGWMSTEMWRAAEPTIIARPGSRVIMVSSPWGGLDHPYRLLWRQGMSAPSEHVRSWHWPSSVSPLVDAELLEQFRQRSAPDYFEREYLAEWTDDGSSYFPVHELDAAVADYDLLPPEEAAGDLAVAGVDWGFKRDANALVLVSVLDDGQLNDDRFPDEPVFYVPWLEQAHQLPYTQFIERVVRVGAHRDSAWNGQGGYYLRWVLAEENGVGEPAIQQLRQHARPVWPSHTSIRGVWTTNKLKANGYGNLRLLIQQGRMVLPRHPELLKQLHALQVEMLPSGGMRIEVPSNVGHDDLADALMQAMASVRTNPIRAWPEWSSRSEGEVLTTGAGTRIRQRPVPLMVTHAFTPPRVGDTSDDW